MYYLNVFHVYKRLQNCSYHIKIHPRITKGFLYGLKLWQQSRQKHVQILIRPAPWLRVATCHHMCLFSFFFRSWAVQRIWIAWVFPGIVRTALCHCVRPPPPREAPLLGDSGRISPGRGRNQWPHLQFHGSPALEMLLLRSYRCCNTNRGDISKHGMKDTGLAGVAQHWECTVHSEVATSCRLQPVFYCSWIEEKWVSGETVFQLSLKMFCLAVPSPLPRFHMEGYRKYPMANSASHKVWLAKYTLNLLNILTTPHNSLQIYRDRNLITFSHSLALVMLYNACVLEIHLQMPAKKPRFL